MLTGLPYAPAATAPVAPGITADVRAARSSRADVLALVLIVTVAVVMWLPRRAGPIDLRWDGAVYYILGTSLAEGRGYRLLNEPGDIAAVQYPPLLPAIVAAHHRLLGTTDPTTVGRALRVTACLIFIFYAIAVLRFLRTWLSVRYAVLGTLLSLLCLHAWFLSDALFPEVWFGLATILFLMSAARGDSRVHGALAYFWAVVAYSLRTVGLAGLAVWVLESMIRRRFRQAALRATLAVLPVAAWQMYVAAAERSHEYKQPAYEYQRAPYLFYNVSYARNIALRDPFTPEKGPVRIERRVVRNALSVPVHLGETLSASSGYFDMWLHGATGDGPVRDRAIRWGVFALLSVFGGVLVFGGMAVLLRGGHTIVPMYILVYTAALCLTPFPGQYLRYLMPVAPLLALCAISLLLHGGRRSRRAADRHWMGSNLPVLVLGPALLIQAITAATVYAREYQTIEYVDAAGSPVSYRLFFYNQAQREFDQVVEYLRAHARADDVVAAGTPHWIYLRTGLKAVMPPFEADTARAQTLLEGVPARYLVIGKDVVATERYTAPVVRQFGDRWTVVYSTPAGWTVYRRND